VSRLEGALGDGTGKELGGWICRPEKRGIYWHDSAQPLQGLAPQRSGLKAVATQSDVLPFHVFGNTRVHNAPSCSPILPGSQSQKFGRVHSIDI
jgi:hypothetical protein